MSGEPKTDQQPNKHVVSNESHESTAPLPMDMNMYATRKTIAQGIMDLGLMCANASQLKYVLLNSGQHKYFEVTIALITLSIILQVIANCKVTGNLSF